MVRESSTLGRLKGVAYKTSAGHAIQPAPGKGVVWSMRLD